VHSGVHGCTITEAIRLCSSRLMYDAMVSVVEEDAPPLLRAGFSRV
jgi:hypothetical protein